MTTRNRLKSWLCASSLLCALALGRHSSAAEPLAPDDPSLSTSKTKPAPVKPAQPRIRSRVARVTPLHLQAEPRALPEPSGNRNEIIWHGLHIPTIIAFGLSGLSAGGALATGFAAARGNDPRTCDSPCAEHDVRQRALLLTTGVLTGMAAAGIGIGITFMVKAPRNRHETAIRPRFDATISGEKAIAKVGWVFSSF